MLVDGLTLTSGSEILNVHVESGTEFPANPDQGRVYYLTDTYLGNDKGLYIFDGTRWATGDITKITTGVGLTGSASFGDVELSLENSGVVAGVYGSDTNIPVITVDVTGRITDASEVAVTIPSGDITLIGDVTGAGVTGSNVTTTLANSGVVSGVYNNSSTAVTPITVDAKGRITSVGSNVTITPAWSSITNKPTTLTGYNITDAQPLDADLTAIAELSGTSGVLRKTANNTWELDTSSYITGNQSVTFSGDVTGSGSTTVTLTLANSGVIADTYTSVTVDAKGRVTAGSKPTTLNGYGIIDAQPLDADLTAIASLSGTSGLLKKTGADTWILDTNSYLTGNQSITISGDASGTGTTAISLTLGNSGVSAGVYNSSATTITPFTIDAKGRVTGTGTAVTIAPAWSSITSKPTTISGFGISDAYTKTEIDSFIQGLDPKASVVAATTTNISLSGTQTIDNIVLAVGDRVLVKNQTNLTQNGIYVVASGAWVRSIDMDAWSEVPGAYVFVEKGSTLADTGWVCTADQGGSFGSTNISWVQFIGAGSVTSGAGISVIGTQVSLASGIVSPDTYTSVTVDTYGRVTAGSKPTTLAGYNITDAQPLDADLTAIAGLSGTSGLLKKTGTDTWILDTNSYLTGNQSITISGDASGTGTTAISLTLGNSGVTAGVYNNSSTAITPITVDAKGRITGTNAAVTITPAWSSITSKPTTIDGYGITDALKTTANSSVVLNDSTLTTATLTTSNTNPDQVVDTTSAALYRTVCYKIQVTSGTSYQCSEIMSIHNGSSVSYTENSVINIGANLATFNMDISGGNIRLLVTPANNVTTIKLVKTAINI